MLNLCVGLVSSLLYAFVARRYKYRKGDDICNTIHMQYNMEILFQRSVKTVTINATTYFDEITLITSIANFHVSSICESQALVVHLTTLL